VMFEKSATETNSLAHSPSCVPELRSAYVCPGGDCRVDTSFLLGDFLHDRISAWVLQPLAFTTPPPRSYAPLIVQPGTGPPWVVKLTGRIDQLQGVKLSSSNCRKIEFMMTVSNFPFSFRWHSCCYNIDAYTADCICFALEMSVFI
jgi:hypothetical protein